ncbi:MAG: T9SS type A sorting domain-containing protein [Sphingobacteriaceae bacterium]|nr:T9SS type A sorting domain-containing protein [Sphingobacteriaceae bacterium]
MKKIYLLLFIAFSLKVVQAQTILEIKDEDNGGALVTNSQVFTATVAASSTKTHHFQVKNVSASTKTVGIRRTDNTLNTIGVGDNAIAYYCVDTYCYSDVVTTTVTVLSAGQSFSLLPKLDEASAQGVSNIDYEVFDANNTSDAIIFQIKYNPPASLKESNFSFAHVGSVYPNPSSGNSFIHVNALVDLNQVSVKIFNTLGAVQSEKFIQINKGKNTVTIDSQNFQSGIYFVQIGNDSNRIVKKFTINN